MHASRSLSVGSAKCAAPREKTKRFRSLMKALRAISFVLDCNDQERSGTISLPAEGRIRMRSEDAGQARCPRAVSQTAPGQPWGPLGRHVSVREELAALVPGRVLPFAPGDSRKRGPRLSRGVYLRASAAVERRKASAPEAGGSRKADRSWRAPHRWCGLGTVAPAGAPPPFFYLEARTFVALLRITRLQMHRENDGTRLSAPAQRGRGTA
jgi:hypothetical protein